MQDGKKAFYFDRLSPAEEQGRYKGGERLIEASYIAGRCYSAGATHQTAEPINRKERTAFNEKIRKIEEPALQKWTVQTGFWQNPVDFNDTYGSRKIGEGAEAIVYLSLTGKSVLKVNDGTFHGTWLEFFDRLAIHNTLFPDTCYQLVGFTQRKGFYGEDRLAAIVEQPFIKAERGASFEEVKADVGKMGFVHVKRDDYYNPDFGIILEDLHDENVLLDDNQNLIYIDPAIFLEQSEMQLAGKRIIKP